MGGGTRLSANFSGPHAEPGESSTSTFNHFAVDTSAPQHTEDAGATFGGNKGDDVGPRNQWGCDPRNSAPQKPRQPPQTTAPHFFTPDASGYAT